MPWTAEQYPAAMQRLSRPVRAKAVDIANALLDEGHDEGRAIRIAIAKAKHWYTTRRAFFPDVLP